MSNANTKPEAETVKDFLSQVEETGFEGLGRDKFKNQFLGIAGGSHESVVGSADDKAKFNNELFAGAIFNTATKKVYGKTIQVIPLKVESIWIENGPRDEKGNLGKFVSARAPGTGAWEGSERKRGEEELRDSESKNPITPTDVLYVLDANDIQSGVKAISFRSTGMAILKDFLTITKSKAAKSGKPLPLFGGVWEFETQFNKNEKGNWFAWGNATGPYTINAKFVREITNDEGYSFIAPERKILISGPKDYAQIGAVAEQTYLAAGGAPEETEY